MIIKRPIREPQLCPECGYLLHFRADSAGQLVAYCEGCEIEIPVIATEQNELRRMENARSRMGVARP
jgi:hypothetical protein